jgi:hypothetical protein
MSDGWWLCWYKVGGGIRGVPVVVDMLDRLAASSMSVGCM